MSGSFLIINLIFGVADLRKGELLVLRTHFNTSQVLQNITEMDSLESKEVMTVKWPREDRIRHNEL